MKQIGVYQKKSRAYEATGCIVEEQILERFGAFPADEPEGYYCLSMKERTVLYVSLEKTISAEDLRGSRKYTVFLPDDLPEADPETAAAILNAYCTQTGTVRAHPAQGMRCRAQSVRIRRHRLPKPIRCVRHSSASRRSLRDFHRNTHPNCNLDRRHQDFSRIHWTGCTKMPGNQ